VTCYPPLAEAFGPKSQETVMFQIQDFATWLGLITSTRL